jgi:hypothetical protein
MRIKSWKRTSLHYTMVCDHCGRTRKVNLYGGRAVLGSHRQLWKFGWYDDMRHATVCPDCLRQYRAFGNKANCRRHPLREFLVYILRAEGV